MSPQTRAQIEAPHRSEQGDFGILKPQLFHLLHRLLLPATTLFVLLCAIPILSYPPGRDQGTYLEIGQLLLRGKHLYAQLWDNKPPGIFVTYAVIVKLFGKVMWSVALVDILLLLAVSYLLFRFAEPYLGRGGAVTAVMIHAVWHSAMKYYWIAQPETFQVLCVLLAYFLLLPRPSLSKTRWFVMGLVFGFGFWQKYNFAAFLPLLLFLPFLEPAALDERPPRLAFIISQRSWLTGAAFAFSGFLLTVVITMGWILHSGGWPMMRESQFEVLPHYARMATEQPLYWLMSVTRTYFALGPLTVIATLAALLIGWLTRDLKRLLPIFSAAMVALLSTVMQVRFHSYYFQLCQPFFAVLWAYLAVRSYEAVRALARILRGQNRKLAAILVWILFANVAFWPLPQQSTAMIMQYEQLAQWRSNQKNSYANYPEQLSIELLEGQLDVIDYVARATKPDDSIYLWGSNSLIYFLADREPPTRFILNLGVISKWGKPSWKQEIVEAIRARQPRLIIVAKHDALPTITYEDRDSYDYLRTSFPALEEYILTNYKPSVELRDFVIYEKNERTAQRF